MPIAALRDPANETPPADSLGLAGCETLIVARARDTLAAAAARAESLGYAVTGLGVQMQAEARHLGAIHAAGDLVTTGPTLTNVNDFRAILTDRAPVGG